MVPAILFPRLNGRGLIEAFNQTAGSLTPLDFRD